MGARLKHRDRPAEHDLKDIRGAFSKRHDLVQPMDCVPSYPADRYI